MNIIYLLLAEDHIFVSNPPSPPSLLKEVPLHCRAYRKKGVWYHLYHLWHLVTKAVYNLHRFSFLFFWCWGIVKKGLLLSSDICTFIPFKTGSDCGFPDRVWWLTKSKLLFLKVARKDSSTLEMVMAIIAQLWSLGKQLFDAKNNYLLWNAMCSNY